MLVHMVSSLQRRGVTLRRTDHMLCDRPPELKDQPLLNVSSHDCELNYAGCLRDGGHPGGTELVIFSFSAAGNFSRTECNSRCFFDKQLYGGLGVRGECLCSTNSEPNRISEAQCSAACNKEHVMTECGLTKAQDVFQVDFSVNVSAVRSIVHTEAVLTASSSVLPVSLSWDFGDLSPRVNTSSPSTTEHHKYGVPGRYKVRVSATAAHREVSTEGEVSVELPPRLKLHCPSLLVANQSLAEGVTLVNWGGMGVAVDWTITKDGEKVARAEPVCAPDAVHHADSMRCFQLVPGEFSWSEARRQCSTRGGELAVVRIQDVRSLLAPHITHSIAWKPGFFQPGMVWLPLLVSGVSHVASHLLKIALPLRSYPVQHFSLAVTAIDLGTVQNAPHHHITATPHHRCNTTPQHHITATSQQYHITAAPQHRSTTSPQHRSTTSPQHHSSTTTLQHHINAVPQHRSTTSPQHRSTTTPQHHCSTTTPEHHITAVPQHRNTTSPLYHNTAAPHHRCTTTPQHHITATPLQYRNTAAPQHRNTTAVPQHHCSTTTPQHHMTTSPLYHNTTSPQHHNTAAPHHRSTTLQHFTITAVPHHYNATSQHHITATPHHHITVTPHHNTTSPHHRNATSQHHITATPHHPNAISPHCHITALLHQNYILILLLMERGAWLGLSDVDSPGTLHWVNGSVVLPGEVGARDRATLVNGNVCVSLDHSGVTSAHPCNAKRAFVCQFTRQGPPQDHHRAGMMWVVDHSQHCSDTEMVVVLRVSDAGVYVVGVAVFNAQRPLTSPEVSPISEEHTPSNTVELLLFPALSFVVSGRLSSLELITHSLSSTTQVRFQVYRPHCQQLGFHLHLPGCGDLCAPIAVCRPLDVTLNTSTPTTSGVPSCPVLHQWCPYSSSCLDLRSSCMPDSCPNCSGVDPLPPGTLRPHYRLLAEVLFTLPPGPSTHVLRLSSRRVLDSDLLVPLSSRQVLDSILLVLLSSRRVLDSDLLVLLSSRRVLDSNLLVLLTSRRVLDSNLLVLLSSRRVLDSNLLVLLSSRRVLDSNLLVLLSSRRVLDSNLLVPLSSRRVLDSNLLVLLSSRRVLDSNLLVLLSSRRVLDSNLLVLLSSRRVLDSNLLVLLSSRRVLDSNLLVLLSSRRVLDSNLLVQKELEDLPVAPGDFIALQHDAGPSGLLSCSQNLSSPWKQSFLVQNRSDWLDANETLEVEGDGEWVKETVCQIRVLYAGQNETKLEGPFIKSGLPQPGDYSLEVRLDDPDFLVTASCPIHVIPPLGLVVIHPPNRNGTFYFLPNQTSILVKVRSEHSAVIGLQGSNKTEPFQRSCPQELASRLRECNTPEPDNDTLFAWLDLQLSSTPRHTPVVLHAQSEVTEARLEIQTKVEEPLQGLHIEPHPSKRVLMESVVSYKAAVKGGTDPSFRWTVDDKPYFTYYNTELNIIYQNAAVYKLTVTAMNNVSSLTEDFNVTVDRMNPMSEITVTGVPEIVTQGRSQTFSASLEVDVSVDATFRVACESVESGHSTKQTCVYWLSQQHTLSSTRSVAHAQRHTPSGTRPAAHAQRHTLSGTRSAAHAQRHTLSGTRSAAHAQRHTLSGTRSAAHGQRHTLSCTRSAAHAQHTSYCVAFSHPSHTLSGTRSAAHAQHTLARPAHPRTRSAAHAQRHTPSGTRSAHLLLCRILSPLAHAQRHTLSTPLTVSHSLTPRTRSAAHAQRHTPSDTRSAHLLLCRILSPLAHAQRHTLSGTRSAHLLLCRILSPLAHAQRHTLSSTRSAHLLLCRILSPLAHAQRHTPSGTRSVAHAQRHTLSTPLTVSHSLTPRTRPAAHAQRHTLSSTRSAAHAQRHTLSSTRSAHLLLCRILSPLAHAQRHTPSGTRSAAHAQHTSYCVAFSHPSHTPSGTRPAAHAQWHTPNGTRSAHLLLCHILSPLAHAQRHTPSGTRLAAHAQQHTLSGTRSAAHAQHTSYCVAFSHPSHTRTLCMPCNGTLLCARPLSIYSLRWSFGDGGNMTVHFKPPSDGPNQSYDPSKKQVPLRSEVKYTYTQPGEYTLVVSVSNRYENKTCKVPVHVYSILTVVEIKSDPELLKAGVPAEFEAHPLPSPYGIIYTWNFGDNTDLQSGRERRVNHTYKCGGMYSVCVDINNTVSSTNSCKAMMVYEDVEGLEVTSSSPTELNTPTVITATLNTGNNVTWSFAMGDGTVQVGVEPRVEHTYVKDGNYTVNVSATNAVSSKWVTVHVQVFVLQVLWLEPAGCVQEKTDVSFRAYVSGNASAHQYVWSFGDGTTNETHYGTPSIAHSYYSSGNYHLSLLMSSSANKANFFNWICVQPSIANVTLESFSTHIRLGEESRFTVTAIPTFDYVYLWDFGISDSTGPIQGSDKMPFTYKSPGLYLVTVTVLNNISYSNCTVQVEVHQPVGYLLIQHNGSQTNSLALRQHYTFLSSSDSANVVYLWDFGDGTVLPGHNVTHSYNSSGVFNICVTGKNEVSENKSEITVTVLAPIQGLWVNSSRVNVPLNASVNFEAHLDQGDDVRYSWILCDRCTSIPGLHTMFYTFRSVGAFNVIVTAENNISTKQASIFIFVQRELEGLQIMSDELGEGCCFATNRVLHLQALLKEGTNMSFSWNVLREHENSAALNLTSKTIELNYSTPGPCEVLLKATNLLGQLAVNRTIEFLDPVGKLVLEAFPNPTTISTNTNFTVFANIGTNVQYRWSVDGQQLPDYVSSILHVFDSPGLKLVNVEVSNRVNVETASVLISVQEPVSGVSFGTTNVTEQNFVASGVNVSLRGNVRTGSNVSWMWLLPNGARSSQQATSYVFPAPGTFTITLNASNDISSETLSRDFFVQDRIQGLEFKASKQNVAVGDNVEFTISVSSGTAVSYTLSISGDATVHPSTTYVHQFNRVDNYYVNLTASNQISSERRNLHVCVLEPITKLTILDCCEKAIPVGVAKTFEVQIETGKPVAYVWTFKMIKMNKQINIVAYDNDGKVTYTPEAPGNLTIYLSAFNALTTVNKTEVVLIEHILKSATLEAQPQDTFVNKTVTFTAGVSPPSTSLSYRWDFGDGTDLLSSTPRASHIYSLPGNYTAQVNISNQVSWVSARFKVNIQVLECSEPEVQVVQAPRLAIWRSKPALVVAKVNLKGCTFYGAEYLWEIFSTPYCRHAEEYSPPYSKVHLPAEVDVRRLQLSLPKMSLAAKNYTLIFSLSYQGIPLKKSACLQLSVMSAKLVPIIEGGTYRVWSKTQDLKLSGVQSYDPNLDPESQTLLNYHWQCVNTS
ncbi:hypothetical protein NFI96_028243, partial [Prochilodus magdalenae]